MLCRFGLDASFPDVASEEDFDGGGEWDGEQGPDEAAEDE